VGAHRHRGFKTAVFKEASAKQLGVSPFGQAPGETAVGPKVDNLCPVRLAFPGTVGWDIAFAAVTGVDLTGQIVHGQQIVALIGRDLLSNCILLYNGSGGVFSIAF
jgi:hypothetical protein